MAPAAVNTPPRQTGVYAGWRATVRSRVCLVGDRTEGRACLSCHHIDDPLRYHDHLLGRLAIECPFYCIKAQNGSLNLGACRISSDCDIGALLTVDLDRKYDQVLDQQVWLEF